MTGDNFDPTNPNPKTLSVGEQTETTNKAGGQAYNPFTPEFSLYKKVLNNLVEDSYYEPGEESFRDLQQRFQAAADESPEFPLQLAAYARQEMGFRDVAQALLVLSANHEDAKQHVREYTPSIIDRTDEFNTVLGFQLGLFGKPVPKPLQKGIDDALHEKYAIVEFDDGETDRLTYVDHEEDDESLVIALVAIHGNEEKFDPEMDIGDALETFEVVDGGYVHDDYTCAKYLQRNHEVSLYDVLNLVRPKPRSENRQQLFEQIAKGELDEGETAKPHWEQGPVTPPTSVDPLRNERTWEAQRSDDDDDRSEAEQWRDTLDDMGLMARVRNLRNMREAGLSGEEIFDYDDGQFGEESRQRVREHQMFPFRFYQAWKACSSDTFYDGIGRYNPQRGEDLLDEFSKEWLEGAIDAACANVPDTFENTFVAIDLSGSMSSPVSGNSEMECAEIGALFGAILAKRDCDIGVFASDFALVDTSGAEDMSVFELASEIMSLSDEVGGSTNGYKAIDWATSEGEVYDRFVFLTDLQLWDSRSYRSDRSQHESWDQYVEMVDGEPHLYNLDLQSYGELQMPEGYQNVHQVSGWDESILEFVDSVEQADDVLAEIQEITPGEY